MDDLWKFLGMNIPVGVALLVMARMFLTHVEEQRAKDNETVMKALDNNTNAMLAMAKEAQAQGLIIAALARTLEQHDEMVCQWIQRYGVPAPGKEPT